MKKFTQFLESYEMEMEKYDDFAEEHAKVVISNYIDGKLDGVSLQDAFETMCRDNGLDEDEEGPQEMTIQALETLAEEILNQARSLEPCRKMSKQQELDAGKKPIGDNPGAL